MCRTPQTCSHLLKSICVADSLQYIRMLIQSYPEYSPWMVSHDTMAAFAFVQNWQQSFCIQCSILIWAVSSLDQSSLPLGCTIILKLRAALPCSIVCTVKAGLSLLGNYQQVPQLGVSWLSLFLRAKLRSLDSQEFQYGLICGEVRGKGSRCPAFYYLSPCWDLIAAASCCLAFPTGESWVHCSAGYMYYSAKPGKRWGSRGRGARLPPEHMAWTTMPWLHQGSKSV